MNLVTKELFGCLIRIESNMNRPETMQIYGHFCLNYRTIHFSHLSEVVESQRINNSKEWKVQPTLISPVNLLSQDSQFWFVFERQPNFNETGFNIDNESINDRLA